MSRRLVVVPNNYTETVSRTANNILQQGKSTISKHSHQQSNPTQSLSSRTHKSSRSHQQHCKQDPPQYNDYLVENEHPRNIFSDGTTDTHTFIPPELSQDSRQHLYNSITTAGHHYSSYTPTHNLIKNTPFQASKQFDTTRHFRILENQHQKEYTDAKNEQAQYFSRFYLVSDSETGIPTSTTQPLSGLRHINQTIPTQTTIAQNNIQIMQGNVFGHKHPFDPRIDIINKQKQSTLPSSLGSSLPPPPSSSSTATPTATSTTVNNIGRGINNQSQSSSQQESTVNRAVTWVSNLFGQKQHYSTYNHYIPYNRYYQYQYNTSTRSFIPKSTIQPFQSKSMITTSKYYFSSMSSTRHMQREAVIKPKPFSRHRYDVVQLQYNKSFLKRFHNVIKPMFEPNLKSMNNNNNQHSASRSYTNTTHYYNNNSSSSTTTSQPKQSSSSSSSQRSNKRYYSTTITTMMRLFNSSRNNNSYNKSTGTFDEGCNFARQQQQIHKELQPSSTSTTSFASSTSTTSSPPPIPPPGVHVSRDTLMNSTCGTPYSHRLKTPTSTTATATTSSTNNPIQSTSTANNSATSTSTGSKSSMNTTQSSSSLSHEQSRMKTQPVQNDIDEAFQPPIQHPISTTARDTTSRLDPLHKQQQSH